MSRASIIRKARRERPSRRRAIGDTRRDAGAGRGEGDAIPDAPGGGYPPRRLGSFPAPGRRGGNVSPSFRVFFELAAGVGVVGPGWRCQEVSLAGRNREA